MFKVIVPTKYDEFNEIKITPIKYNNWYNLIQGNNSKIFFNKKSSVLSFYPETFTGKKEKFFRRFPKGNADIFTY